MSISKQLKIFVSLLLAGIMLIGSSALMISCDREGGAVGSSSTTSQAPNSTETNAIIGGDSPYHDLDLSEYISLGQYTGLTIEYNDAEIEKSDLIWERVVEEAKVLKYPEDQVLYYFEQTKTKYMDYASGNTDQYESVLNHFRVTEEDMMEDARGNVKEDLVYYYMVKESEIELTDEEKNALFDKYVDFYVEKYKYSRDYVIANMTSLIYDTMLYDKTMEYLILNNTFVYTGTDTTDKTTGTTETEKVSNNK